MPFGLVNAPAIFQNFMNEFFRDILFKFTIVYLDDILIYSKSLSEHVNQVSTVLERLRKHNLFLKLEKWQFHLRTIHFLGYIISHNQVAMDQGKVDAV